MEKETRRGAVLTIFAALFVLLALSDISKPPSGGRAGLVFFGTKTTGLANAILAPAFGIFLLIYASGIWWRMRWAVPMAWIYAAYVPINLTLFTIKTPEKWQSPFFASVYVAIAVGVSSGWQSCLLATSGNCLEVRFSRESACPRLSLVRSIFSVGRVIRCRC